MPSAPTRNRTIAAPSDVKSNGQRSQRPAEPDQKGIGSSFEEVTFLRLPGVKEITGLSKSSLYALIQEKSFPAPVRLGARTVAWVKSEVRQWALERIRASREAA
jgi:prophage regulatory protein